MCIIAALIDNNINYYIVSILEYSLLCVFNNFLLIHFSQIFHASKVKL